MSFLHTPLDRDTWNRFLFQNKFLHFDRYPFGKDFSLLRKSWDKQQLTEMVDILWKEEKLAKSVNYFLCGFGHWKWLYSFTVKPVYNGPVRSGHTVYYCNRTTSQNFHWPYISCKVELYIAVTLYITVTLPFPKGDRCTQVWPVVPGWPIQAFRLWRWCERCEQKKQRVGWEWRFPPISFFLSSSHHPSYFFPALWLLASLHYLRGGSSGRVQGGIPRVINLAFISNKYLSDLRSSFLCILLNIYIQIHPRPMIRYTFRHFDRGFASTCSASLKKT